MNVRGEESLRKKNKYATEYHKKREQILLQKKATPIEQASNLLAKSQETRKK